MASSETFRRIADLGIIEGIVNLQLVAGCGTSVVTWLLVTSGRIEARQVIAGGAQFWKALCLVKLSKHSGNQSRDLGEPTDAGFSQSNWNLRTAKEVGRPRKEHM